MNQIIACITGDIDSGENEDIRCLTAYFDVLDKYNIKATIPVTAKAVEDYPERIEYILKRGHEIAGHGDIHQQAGITDTISFGRNLVLRKCPGGTRLHALNTCSGHGGKTGPPRNRRKTGY